MVVGCSTPRPGSLTLGKEIVTHFTESWVGPRAGLGGCGKSHSLHGFNPRTVQPVASRYTDRATPA